MKMKIILLLVLNAICVQSICIFLKKMSYGESCIADGHCNETMVCVNSICSCDECWFYKEGKCVQSDLCESFLKQDFLTITTNVTHNFRNFISLNNSYYLTDRGNSKILIYNRSWKLQNEVVSITSYPWYILFIGSHFYMTTRFNGILKTLMNFTVVKVYTASSNPNGYRSMFYDEEKQEILVANENSMNIQRFDLNLNLLSVEFTSTDGAAHGIYIFEGITYISTAIGRIIKVINKTKISVFQTECTSYITQIIIDEAGVIAVPCYIPRMIMLYHINGTYLNKTIISSSLFTDFDLDKKLVVITFT